MDETAIKALIAASLTEAGYLTKTEFNATAAMIRNMGNDNTATKAMLSSMFDKAEDGTFTLKAAPTATAKVDGKVDVMAEVNALKAQLKQSADSLVTERKTAADTARKLAIQGSLTKNGAVNPGRDSVHLFDQVKLDAAGEYVVFSKDANGLDMSTPLDAHVGGWLKANPELVRAQSKTGSGTPGATGSTPGSVKLSEMSGNDYAANRAAIMSGKIGIE